MTYKEFEKKSRRIKEVIQNNEHFQDTIMYIIQEVGYTEEEESEAVYACIGMIEKMFEDYRRAKEEEEEEDEDY